MRFYKSPHPLKILSPQKKKGGGNSSTLHLAISDPMGIIPINSDDFHQVIANFTTLLHLKKERYPHLKLLISSVLTPHNTQDPKSAFTRIFGQDSTLIDTIQEDIALYNAILEKC